MLSLVVWGAITFVVAATGVQATAPQNVSINSLPLVSVSRDRMDYIALLCSVVLVGVGIAGVLAALRTLNAVKAQAEEMKKQAAEMGEQTMIAQENAKAAYLNAQTLINSERPWLMIETSFSGDGDFLTFNFKAVNRGRSPAQVMHFGLQPHNIRVGETMPKDFPYRDAELPEARLVHTIWVAPGKNCDLDCYNVHSMASGAAASWQQIKSGERLLIITGFVRYRDTFSNQVHESRYCYQVSSQSGSRLVMTGPPGYNDLT